MIKRDRLFECFPCPQLPTIFLYWTSFSNWKRISGFNEGKYSIFHRNKESKKRGASPKRYICL